MKSPIKRLRITGLIEGISFLVLLFIAMPIKHFLGNPMPVKIIGWIHGILFMAFIFSLTEVLFKHKWSMKKAAASLLASLVPFGTFYMDKFWKQEEEKKAE